MSEYEDLKKKAKSFGINIGAIEDEIDRRAQMAVEKSHQAMEARFTELITSKLPSLDDIVSAVVSHVPAPSIDIDAVTKEVATRLPNTGSVEEARIAKQVQDALFPLIEKYLTDIINKFKLGVAEELKAIRDNNEKLIQQSIVGYKDGITQEVNKHLDVKLKDISEKIESPGDRESKVDKYLPFLEKLVGNERQAVDPFDAAINQAEKFQRLSAIFSGQGGPDPNVVYNNQSRAMIEGMKLLARARDASVSPKYSGPSKGPFGMLGRRTSNGIEKNNGIDPIIARL
jgi:hypothetical protein